MHTKFPHCVKCSYHNKKQPYELYKFPLISLCSLQICLFSETFHQLQRFIQSHIYAAY